MQHSDKNPVVVRQIKLSRMETFCHLVGDSASKTGLLIDPAFDTDQILAAAATAGFTITTVVNTHRHADHCCGNAAVMAATGARLHIHEKDARQLTGFFNGVLCRLLGGRPSPRPDVVLRHGESVVLGQTTLTVLHTPGHTPGSICLYIPGHIFTGDTLFVGSAGRTDLAGGSTKGLQSSIRTLLFPLPDDTRIWPGHDYGDRPVSTLGHEKKTNPFMQTGFGGSKDSRG